MAGEKMLMMLIILMKLLTLHSFGAKDLLCLYIQYSYIAFGLEVLCTRAATVLEIGPPDFFRTKYASWAAQIGADINLLIEWIGNKNLLFSSPWIF